MVAVQYKEPIRHIDIARRQDRKSLAKGDENRNLSEELIFGMDFERKWEWHTDCS